MAVKDQSRYRKMSAELVGYRAIRRLLPFGYLFGPKAWKAVREARTEIDKNLPFVEQQLFRFTEIPDEFNATFGPHGWISTDELDLGVQEAALAAAKQDGLEAGEQYLEDHYNERLSGYLELLLWLPTIYRRRALIELAADDHRAGRYHASVPVILAQIDGICFDLTKKTFFERGKNAHGHLVARETTVGDSDGLPRLAKALSKGRGTTRESPTSRPHRNGILHGRDLGYANRRSSTKAMAALFAMRTWIRAVERGEQFKPPEEFFDPAKATWKDVKREFQELARRAREVSGRRRSGYSDD